MRAFAILLLGFTGCIGDGDASTLGGDIVGRWRILPNTAADDPPDPIADRQVLQFNADNSYTESENGRTTTGSYTIENGELELLGQDETEGVRVPYLATNDRFVFGVLLRPEGSADDFVGTWTATIGTPEDVSTLTIDLAADLTSQVEYDDAARAGQVYDGTWRAVNDDLEVEYMPQENFTVHIRATRVAGVLGTAYERI